MADMLIYCNVFLSFCTNFNIITQSQASYNMLKGLLIFGICAIVAALCFVGYFYYKSRTIEDTHDLATKIEHSAKRFLAEKKGVGLAIGIVQGDKVYKVCYGFASLETQTPIDASTIFEIGSISKVFTTEIAEILARKGLIDWKSSVHQNLPPIYQSASDDGTNLLHLATHTAGYQRLPQVFLDKMSDECNPYKTLTSEDFWDYIKHPTDKKKPDPKIFEYSNIGNALLGNILELKTGKTYEALLQSEICVPLNMQYTSLSVKDSTKFATGYDEQGNKTCHWDFPIIYAAGAIRSDINDMTTFLKANMQENNLYAAFKETHNKVFDASMGGIGKGWNIDSYSGKLFGLENIVWHNGGTGGFSSYIGILPNQKVGIVVLSNQSSEELDKLAIRLLVSAGKISLTQ